MDKLEKWLAGCVIGGTLTMAGLLIADYGRHVAESYGYASPTKCECGPACACCEVCEK